MEDVLTFAPLAMLLIVISSSLVVVISQRRLTAAYKRAYEQAIERAKANGEQVDRALDAAESWKTSCGKWEQNYLKMKESFDSLYASYQDTLKEAAKANELANSALDECAKYRAMMLS